MSQQAFRVRAAEKDDADRIARLIGEIEQFYGSAEDEIAPMDVRIAQVGDALFGSAPLAWALLAESPDGSLAGFAAYSFLWPAAGATHSLYLKELYISERYRRQGLGKSLLDALAEIAASRPGCSRIEWTADRDNPGARAFYQKLGFAEIDSKVMYRKTLL